MSDDLNDYLKKQETVENGCLVAIGVIALVLLAVAALDISGVI